jgi:hypothetical protein
MDFICPYEIELRNLLQIALSGAKKGLGEGNNGSNVTNVQYKSNQNCHYESPQYNKYILIKNL